MAIKTALGAQRYNNRIDRVFNKATELRDKHAAVAVRCGFYDAQFTLCKNDAGIYVSHHRCI